MPRESEHYFDRPRCPASAQADLSMLFKERRSGTLMLAAKETPQIKGDIAVLNVARTRQTETVSTSGTVPFQFQKQGDRWLTEIGSF